MTVSTLSQKQLNRSYLARQMLIKREEMPLREAVARLVGLQSQVNNPPYIGLWTRLADFHRQALTEAMERREIVRAALMRSTLHLFTAEDFLALYTALQPALARALNAFFGQRAKGLDIPALVEAARAEFSTGPKTFVELREALLAVAPGRDVDALNYAVRSYLPIVQVPPGGVWGRGGSPPFALAESYLGAPVQPENTPLMIRRYLAAYGPASVADMQAWSGVTRLKEAVGALKDEWVVFRDESGRELLDLPNCPFPDPETPVPVRFIPEYDNLILSHADRTRVMPNEYRQYVYLSAGRVRATILVDGFVRGAWKITREKARAVLTIEPFAALDADAQAELAAEGERLLHFVEEDAAEYAIEFAALLT